MYVYWLSLGSKFKDFYIRFLDIIIKLLLKKSHVIGNPTSCRAVLSSTLLNGRCRDQSPLLLVNLVFTVSCSFLRISPKYGIESLKETTTEGTPSRKLRSRMRTTGLIPTFRILFDVLFDFFL